MELRKLAIHSLLKKGGTATSALVGSYDYNIPTKRTVENLNFIKRFYRIPSTILITKSGLPPSHLITLLPFLGFTELLR